MAKVPLTIDPGYCSSWGFWEGIRELIQNAKDADEFEGLKMTVQHSSRGEKLTISTAGVSLPSATLLLLGASSKRGGDQRGKFGEGFSLGCLALARAGFPVTIYNGDEVWRPTIEKAEDGAFVGQELLVFSTRKLQSTRPDFTVEIENVTKPVWEATEKMFLFLSEPPAKETVKLTSGDRILLGDEYKGKLFCRGIFVTKLVDLECGYDLERLPLDRDRKVVEEWDLKWRLANLWKEAHDLMPKFASKIYTMAKEERPEVKQLTYRADDKLIAALHSEFEKEHGEGVIAVGTMEESREIEKLGGKSVIVDKTLRELLEKSGASVSAAKAKLQGTIQVRHTWSSLTPDEQAKCQEWIERVTKDYCIVDFNDETKCRWAADEDKIAVARSLLTATPREILRSVASHTGTKRGVPIEVVLLDVIFGKPA